MREQPQTSRHEPRWPVILSIAVLLGLLMGMTERIRIFPGWLPFTAAIAGIMPMAAVALTAGRSRWLRVERVTTLLLFALTEAGTLAGLARLIGAMISGPAGASGLQLLTSSIAVWATNVLSCSLLYWQIDRGGPEARSSGAGKRPEWLFPQAGTQEQGQPEWRPQFIDYLFLSYSTSTAFSATDVAPLSARAKLLMMFESSISLLTILLVAARAVNILG